MLQTIESAHLNSNYLMTFNICFVRTAIESKM